MVVQVHGVEGIAAAGEKLGQPRVVEVVAPAVDEQHWRLAGLGSRAASVGAGGRCRTSVAR